ncbi:hypothetical protein PTI98_008412 [Pleurotus ostreatus]|nr:hypothetical protein PTI98_008412 [Pleurotus ostreatus]
MPTNCEPRCSYVLLKADGFLDGVEFPVDFKFLDEVLNICPNIQGVFWLLLSRFCNHGLWAAPFEPIAAASARKLENFPQTQLGPLFFKSLNHSPSYRLFLTRLPALEHFRLLKACQE